MLAIILLLRLVGERSWVVTILLYLPRLGFALPLPFVALLLLVFGPRPLLLAQLVSVALLVFPLMGLRLSGPAAPTPDAAAHLRVVSYNVDSGRAGPEAIVAQLRATKADVILLQEIRGRMRAALKDGLNGYQVHTSGQFWTASRYPIEEVFEAEPVMHDGVSRSSRFIRYRLALPSGPIYVYSVHPVSPREALDDLRGEGLRSEMASGRIFSGSGAPGVIANTSLRVQQIRGIAEDAARSPYPTLIVGDTNLPTLSWAFSHWLGRFRDGFAEVGRGFGYTFPAPKHPWMRIDRILASPRFRFLSFAVAQERTSDHFAVTAELELTRR